MQKANQQVSRQICQLFEMTAVGSRRNYSSDFYHRRVVVTGRSFDVKLLTSKSLKPNSTLLLQASGVSLH